MKLLHIYAVPNGQHSRTLDISNQFLASLKTKNPDLQVNELNLIETKLPEVFGAGANAKFTLMRGQQPEGEVLDAWEELSFHSNNFLAHDFYLLTIPMWNFSIPYKLKHYIDVIVQPGLMFQFTATGVEGLVHNKKMICITGRGSDYSLEGPMGKFDFMEPYIRSIFGFTGIYDIQFINAQPLDIDPEISKLKIEEAVIKAQSVASNMMA